MNQVWNFYRTILVVIVVVSLSPAMALASEADPVIKEDQAYLQLLKEAIATNNKTWIADQVDFPITVTIGGKRRRIMNKRAFLAHYKDIINQKVRSAVLEQDPETLFKDWKGLMIGNGEIWFNATMPSEDALPKDYDYYISGINN